VQQHRPRYRIPTNIQFTITIDGTGLKKPDLTSLVMIGPGYDIGVEDINLRPGGKDTLKISRDGRSISYTTQQSESPTIIVGLDGTDADYAFALRGVDVDGGGTINVMLDTGKGSLNVSSAGTAAAGAHSIAVARYTGQDTQTFGHNDVALAPTDTATLQFGAWKTNGEGMPLVIAHAGGGEDTITLTDDD
jgi:hypothetical protein